MSVHQYDLEGNYIQSYSTAYQATLAIGCKKHHIYNAVDTHRTVKSYRFTSNKYDKLPQHVSTKGRGKKQIYLYDLDGNLIKEFSSRKEVLSYFNITKDILDKVLKVGTIDEYKISSVKVDKFVEFKSRKFVSNY